MPRSNAANQNGLEYAFRRVIYDLMVVAHSIRLLEYSDNKPVHPSLKKFPVRAVIKISALIMSRNINDFLFNCGGYQHDDDIKFVDFQIHGWSPINQAKLSDDDRNRIHKIAGHIVSADPVHFGGTQKIKKIVTPLLKEGCEFIRRCGIQHTDRSQEYLDYLNQSLSELNLPKI